MESEFTIHQHAYCNRKLNSYYLQACEKKVQPGISKLTWTSTMSDAYVADCVTQIGEVSLFHFEFMNTKNIV